MYEDQEIFDINDTIIFQKDKIVLEKIEKNNKLCRTTIKKHLKELDGHWELDVIDDSNSENNVNNEQWIENHNDDIYKMFIELKHKSSYSDILSKLTFCNLCTYLESCSRLKYKYKNKDWNTYEEYKLYGLKNPSEDEWASFHIQELHFLYNLSYQTTTFCLGTMQLFIRFCYENSYTKTLPKY